MDRKTKEKHLPYFGLLEALRAGGCPACVAADRLAARYVEALLYEQVTDPPTRLGLRQSLGFCGPHARLLLGCGDELGPAIIYQDLLEHLDWEGLRANSAREMKEEACPVCHSALQAAERCLLALIDYADDASVCSGFEHSPGLCLQHLLRLAALAGDRPGVEGLLALQRRKLDELGRDLSELIRKHDYRFSSEPRTEEERTGLHRVIQFFTGGRPGLQRPRREAIGSRWLRLFGGEGR